MTDILSMTYEKLLDLVTTDLSEKRFRADQIFTWLHQRRVKSFDEMTDLSKPLRDRLSKEAFITYPKIIKKLSSKIDGTIKYLFEMADGERIESVLMRYKTGLSVCLSSEAGCPMGCRFCASAQNGKSRDLTPGEILSQLYSIEDDIGERVSHAVLMGTGEPLDNYENVISFLHIVSDKRGQDMSLRNVTLSTCGIAPNIKRLAGEGLPITLALSLHSPIQSEREKIMPIAKVYPLTDVMEACRYYFEKTKRRVTLEYSLMKGVNDRDVDVEALKKITKDFPCHVNLIPVNPVREASFKAPGHSEVLDFRKKVEKCGINVTIRRELGRDIEGSCGQLRNAPAKNNERKS